MVRPPGQADHPRELGKRAPPELVQVTEKTVTSLTVLQRENLELVQVTEMTDKSEGFAERNSGVSTSN